MQYMLLIYGEEGGWEKMTPAEQEAGMDAYNAFTEALRKADALVGAERLQYTDTASTVRVRGDKREVLDGPYADTKEQLAGYYIVETKDLDGALEWAAKCPGSWHGSVEVRPVFVWS